MSPSLRKAVAAAIGGGAVAIASVLITGPSGDDGLEGVSYIPYKDIVGVWTVCHGHTGKDIIPGKTYTVAELQALRQARLDLLTGKRVVSVQKDGRRIEYTAASLDELNRAINDAESVLGTTRRRRRPLGVRL